MKSENRFDPIKHEYFVSTNGQSRPVPSVTQIIRKILGDAIWSASDWYLERGRAVHMAAAFIAQGKQFEFDPVIAGQVAACRKFFADIKPEVLEVEQQVYHEVYGYAGTYDLCAIIQGKTCVVDWKSLLSPVAEIQLGAYALALPQPAPRWGMVVALQEDGNYKTGGIIKLERRKQEFLALRSVYAIRQRMGLIKPKEVCNERKRTG